MSSGQGSGWGNPIAGGTAMRIPALTSPNFNLADPGASPNPSWAILASGIAYFFGIVIANGGITGDDYIVNSSGFFFYDGTPAYGNLIISITPGTSGTDGFGNDYDAGINVYGTDVDVQMYAGQLNFFSSVVNLIATIQITSAGVIEVTGQAGTSFQIGIPVSAAITASEPGSAGTDETWHTITLDSGWTTPALSREAPRYRILPDGNLQLSGAASHAYSASGITLNNSNPIPAGWRPPDSRDYAGDEVGARCHWTISSGGVITCTAPYGVSSGTIYAEINATVPLT